MFELERDVNKKVHFIGIGGISMSALAEILLEYGYNVSGSDRASSHLTDKLSTMGAKIFIGHAAENIGDADIVVYTAAVKDDNPELIAAREKNLIIYDRAEFLGQIMKRYKKGIAIAGTHGKTTTTSLVSLMLLNANLDATLMVGGEVDAIGGNVKVGKSDYFVTEACEYKESFLKFYPYIGVILNVDADHLDYYRDINHIKDAFLKFGKLIPKEGLAVGCADDSNVLEIFEKLDCNKLTYGIKKGDFRAENISYDERGCASFTATLNGSFYGEFKLSIPGEHNVLNSLATIACGHFLGIDLETIRKSLEDFKGTHRRFEKKGEKNGVVVVDDYAHHPAEIIATLKAAKNYPHNKIYCVFQPHTYTRTYSLFKEFSEAFYNVDELILADIYAAREKDTGLVSSKMLSDAIEKNGVKSTYIQSFEEIVEYLKTVLNPGDLLITMGAGDVYKVGEMFLRS
ncbi:UDP-N-acetylmuramate--L-alanine ligase [Caloramator mitchellensis]|uniref:UDP-N-acetylmuramate--L-alanine ligase n=1 Tax=Caloramator mitchellensis TaxID=908809 RepID=A0A0R3JT55_CALMK|nr:UDP-N-acetylmuramate--L-alanine ligase [Caloramator mitchellensis]KRQ86697.1 UDP-N-acetylmuramate--L-alanine ligase [Caloramator mitchellensis]